MTRAVSKPRPLREVPVTSTANQRIQVNRILQLEIEKIPFFPAIRSANAVATSSAVVENEKTGRLEAIAGG
jgi:hypothetical protein